MFNIIVFKCSIEIFMFNIIVFVIILAFPGGKTAVGLSDLMKHKEYTFDEIALFYINIGMSR